jgi:hypothetical protein
VSALQLRPVNSDVYGVYAPTGAHVGNLKRVGPVWKFKAIGYDDDGSVVPGGGPLTDRHNTVFPEPDPALVNVMLDIS